MFRLPRLSRGTRACLAGLLVGIVGLVVQWIADPAKFSGAEGTFGVSLPPGIVFIAVFGLLVLATARWWWHSVFAVLIGFWIVGAGSMADKMQPNFTSHNAGTVAGTAVMAAGLVFAVVAGAGSMVTARRARRAARNSPSIV